MNHSRRLSQAISEGDGISLLVPVDDVEAARSAEAQGAEGIVVSRTVDGLREATGLPILAWATVDSVPTGPGLDACVLRVGSAGDESDLRELHEKAFELGLEPVIGVRDDDELELALEELDPEILLLSAQDDHDPLEQVLDLLPDVPAGKLAIAEVRIRSREDVVALERAGVDAVIVERGDVSRLVSGALPEV